MEGIMKLRKIFERLSSQIYCISNVSQTRATFFLDICEISKWKE